MACFSLEGRSEMTYRNSSPAPIGFICPFFKNLISIAKVAKVYKLSVVDRLQRLSTKTQDPLLLDEARKRNDHWRRFAVVFTCFMAPMFSFERTFQPY